MECKTEQTTQVERANVVTWQSKQTTRRTRLSSKPMSEWQSMLCLHDIWTCCWLYKLHDLDRTDWTLRRLLNALYKNGFAQCCGHWNFYTTVSEIVWVRVVDTGIFTRLWVRLCQCVLLTLEFLHDCEWDCVSAFLFHPWHFTEFSSSFTVFVPSFYT